MVRLFSEILSEFQFVDWFVISTFNLPKSDSCVDKRTFDEFPEMTSVEIGDKSLQFSADHIVQHSDHAGVESRSHSYNGDVIKAFKRDDYFRSDTATHFLPYQYSTQVFFKALHCSSHP